MANKDRKLPREALKAREDYERLHSTETEHDTETIHWYSTAYGTRERCFALYPDGTPKGTVIDIHGGMWTGGNPSRNLSFRKMLRDEGWTVLAPSVGNLPGDDLFSMVRNLSSFMTEVEKRKRPGEKFFITADGTGAYLALLYQALSESRMLRALCNVEASPKIDFRAIAMSQPVLYLSELQGLTPFPLARKRAQKKILALLSRYEDIALAPARRVINFTRFAALASYPPFFMVLDPHDPWTRNSEKPLRAMKKNKIDCTVWDDIGEKGLEPAFNVHSPESPDGRKANEAILRFFEERR